MIFLWRQIHYRRPSVDKRNLGIVEMRSIDGRDDGKVEWDESRGCDASAAFVVCNKSEACIATRIGA